MNSSENAPVPAKAGLSWMASTLIFINLGVCLLVALAIARFGSIGASLAYLRGNRLMADGYSKSFGIAAGGEDKAITFKLDNKANLPITVLGAKTSCSCLVVKQLPATIQPGGSYLLKLNIHTKAQTSGPFAQNVRLFVDMREQAPIDLKITGLIRNTVGAK